MKLHFNVHAVSSCIYNPCHGRQKMLDHLQQNLKFLQIFLRGGYAAKVKKERLFSQLKESLQEATNFTTGTVTLS